MYPQQKNIALHIFDEYWTKHIDDMDKLHKGVAYLQYEQKDPINAYTNRGFELFEQANVNIALQITAHTLNARVVVLNPKGEVQEQPKERDVIDV